MASGYAQRGDLSGEGGLSGRVPPSDLDAEKAVLSAVLLDNDTIHLTVTELRAEDFYHPAHRLLYQAMVARGYQGQTRQLEPPPLTPAQLALGGLPVMVALAIVVYAVLSWS